MRTPLVMILGLVLAPAGFVLILTCTVAPAWRDVAEIPTGATVDEVHHQGLWEICRSVASVRSLSCDLQDDVYFADQIVRIAKGLTIASLVVSAGGILLASFGVRCWTEPPRPAIVGVAGLILVAGGILILIPVSWYTDQLNQIPNTVGGNKLTVGYAAVLGFIGGGLIIIGGFALMFSFGMLRKSKSPALKNYHARSTTQPADKHQTGIASPISVINVPPANTSSAPPWDTDF
ncbi:claudin-23-like [Hypanus sabinus]|uniref:claudin-23-like n=1 Tax=Hypanus sabinus TaxID=79690 RepID=UPI0028C4371F|nr:claudin-23-like [Hypanus sabinus]